MNPNIEKYYSTNKFFLLRIGGWPYQSKVLKILVPCLLSIVQYSVFVVVGLLLYDTWGDVNIAVEGTITLTPAVAANVKLLNIVVNNDKFRCLLQFMNKHWELFNSEFERRILRYYANIGRKVTKYFAVYITTVMTFYLLIPLIPRILDIVIPLNESRPLAYVYPGEYRVDKENYYYLILGHTYITSIITMTILFTVDTTYIVCVLHACSLFTAIRKFTYPGMKKLREYNWYEGCTLIYNILFQSVRLENITGEADIKINDGEKIHTGTHYHLFIERHDSVGNDYHELITCLKKHQLALEHVQTLDSMFTHVTFILLFLNVLLLSVIGLQILNNVGHTEEIIRYVFVSCGVFTHLICMCIPGQLLIDRSTEIFDKAYSSGWHSFSIKTKNLLRVLLCRSLVPCTLTAGKMFVMSMTMCSSVMQTAMSYFTAMLSMR